METHICIWGGILQSSAASNIILCFGIYKLHPFNESREGSSNKNREEITRVLSAKKESILNAVMLYELSLGVHRYSRGSQ